jgi:hypothetical protein
MAEKLEDAIPDGEFEGGEFESVVEIWLFPLLIAMYSLVTGIVVRRYKTIREIVLEVIENPVLGGTLRSLNSAKTLVRTGSASSAKDGSVYIKSPRRCSVRYIATR